MSGEKDYFYQQVQELEHLIGSINTSNLTSAQKYYARKDLLRKWQQTHYLALVGKFFAHVYGICQGAGMTGFVIAALKKQKIKSDAGDPQDASILSNDENDVSNPDIGLQEATEDSSLINVPDPAVYFLAASTFVVVWWVNMWLVRKDTQELFMQDLPRAFGLLKEKEATLGTSLTPEQQSELALEKSVRTRALIVCFGAAALMAFVVAYGLGELVGSELDMKNQDKIGLVWGFGFFLTVCEFALIYRPMKDFLRNAFKKSSTEKDRNTDSATQGLISDKDWEATWNPIHIYRKNKRDFFDSYADQNLSEQQKATMHTKYNFCLLISAMGMTGTALLGTPLLSKFLINTVFNVAASDTTGVYALRAFALAIFAFATLFQLPLYLSKAKNYAAPKQEEKKIPPENIFGTPFETHGKITALFHKFLAPFNALFNAPSAHLGILGTLTLFKSFDSEGFLGKGNMGSIATAAGAVFFISAFLASWLVNSERPAKSYATKLVVNGLKREVEGIRKTLPTSVDDLNEAKQSLTNIPVSFGRYGTLKGQIKGQPNTYEYNRDYQSLASALNQPRSAA